MKMFESLTTKISGPELNLNKSNAQQTQLNEARCYSYEAVKCKGTDPQVYLGPNATELILRQLQIEEE